MITKEQEIRRIIDKTVRYNFSRFDPKDRYIVLVDGKPVQLRGKFHWNHSWAHTMARRIVHPLWAWNKWSNLNPVNMAKKMGIEVTPEFSQMVLKLRNEWFKKHVNVIPLMEYIKARAKMTK